MKIMKETTDVQTLKIIPRSYPDAVDIEITNEDTKKTTSFDSLATTRDRAYLDLKSVFSLKEDTFYNFKVKDSATGLTIYKGKIFCTNQDYYSIQNGEYTSRNQTTQYVTR